MSYLPGKYSQIYAVPFVYHWLHSLASINVGFLCEFAALVLMLAFQANYYQLEIICQK